MGDVATSRLERITEARSRDFGDVAAKLAALIVESSQGTGIHSGGIEGAIHLGLCSCLADLVILGERPLPDASIVLNMHEPDFELRGMTEAEAAEDRAEAAGERGVRTEHPPGGARTLDGAGGEKQVTDRTLISKKDSDRAVADERLMALMRDATLQDRPLFEDQDGAEGPHTERTPDEKMTLDNSEGHSGDRGGAIDPAARENARELASEVQTIAEVLAHLSGTDGHGYHLDPGHVGYLASRLVSVGEAIEGIALGLPAPAPK